MNIQSNRLLRNRGLTAIELMVVVALAGIVAGLAAPAFIETLARNRVEGVATELATDFQYARSEAVARNAQVGLYAGANCYTIFLVNGSASSSCAVPGGTPIKRVTLDGGSAPTLAFSSNDGQAFIQFDPVRGMATDALGVDDWSGSVTVSTSAGGWQLRADITNFGRAKTCSPSGTFKGYPPC